MRFRRARALILSSLVIFAVGCEKTDTTSDEETSESTGEGAELSALDKAAAIRALSFALRDRPPERDAAKAYAQGETSLSQLREEWLASPEHLERVGRFFHDAFGTKRWPEATFGAKALVLDAQAWYQSSDNFPQCSQSSDIEEVEVWWGAPGAKASVCKLADCGPYALRCSLVAHRPQLMDAIRFEFRDRGLYVYTQKLGWDELYLKPFVYGNRLLLHKYFLDSELFTSQNHALKADAPALRQIVDLLFTVPLDEARLSEWPSLGAERAGLVTSPAFLQRFNNFRSRVRALSQGLLCQDIGSWMNPTGLSTFVNQSSLSSFDRDHGGKTACASCHLGLDNWGSTLLGWSDQGSWQWWQSWSQEGAVWGVSGEGPSFLMQSIVGAQDSFYSCMAFKAWSDFSQGKPWEQLTSSEQERLLAAAREGPEPLLKAVFREAALIMTR